MPRPRNKRPVSVKVYQGSHDGLWHGYITIGTKGNGKPDVKHRTGKTREECEDKIRELEDAMAAKKALPGGRSITIEQYLTGWLAGLDLRYKTREDYERVVTSQLIPHLGGHHLTDDGLKPDHVKAMMRAVEKDLSTSAANRAHRVLRTALSQAVREEKLSRNVARLVSPLREETTEVEPLTPVEAQAVLAQVYQLPRNRSRWLIALTLGLRQGECLALARRRPDQPRLPGDIDLEAGTLTVREKLLRHSWRHGCKDPAACARPHCRKKTCPPTWLHGCPDIEVDGKPAHECGKTLAYVCPSRRRAKTCRRHRSASGCPQPCPPGCAGHARACPERRDGGLVKEPPKSNAGKRTLVLPPPLIDALRWDQEQQDADREAAGDLWEESGLWFTTEVGRPLDPRRDWQMWHDILEAAGVDHIRLHGARHGAATAALMAGMDRRVVKEVMGWSQDSMLDRYQHVVDELRKDAAKKIESAWWPSPEPPTDPGNSTDHATVTDQGQKPRRLRAV